VAKPNNALRSADMLIPHEKNNHYVVFWYQQWLVGFRLQFALKVTHHPTPFEKRRLRQIPTYNISTVRDSEKIQLWRMGNRPRAFQRAIDGVRTLPLSPPKGGSKSDFCFLIKFNFNQIKSATKYLCVKTSSAKLLYNHSPI